MFSTVTARRLSVGTVYKLWFVGLGATLLPLGLLLGICALSGYNTVTWNGQPLHGVGALFAGPTIGLGMALLVHLPLIGLLVPGLAALTYIHYGLEALRRLRGGALVTGRAERLPG